NINDTTPADGLILGDEAAVYADRAYDTHERRKNLEQRGVFAGLMHRSSKYHDLSPEQQAFNLQIRPVRAAVERTFGILKNALSTAPESLHRINPDRRANPSGDHGNEHQES